MKERTAAEKRGVRLRTTNFVMVAIALILSVALFLSVYQTNDSYEKTREAAENYITLQKCAQSMQDSSDYLTEQVRGFIMTGASEYLDNYFHEANVSRRRDQALATLKEHLGETETYFALEAAMNGSVDLMQVECYAMRLAVDAYGYRLADAPVEIQSVVLSENDLTLDSQELQTLARELVFNDAYREQKEKISSNTRRCLVGLEEEAETNQTTEADHLRDLLLQQQVLIAALIATILGYALIVSVQVVAPLLRAIPRIREGKSIPVRGAKEFRFLARTYNRISEANRKSKKRLIYEARHDQLTDLLNRNGYESLAQSIDPSNSVLLLIDIDHFKSINDTYGHDVGDKVLELVADTLKANFRENDYIFRFGGDEFAVIMQDADKNCRELIVNKAARINESLSEKREGVPVVSVSVGVAFGKEESESQNLFKEADIALYRVKENKRGGVEFFA